MRTVPRSANSSATKTFGPVIPSHLQSRVHRREASVVVVADALILGAILEIVAEDETDLRIEIGAVLRHQREVVLRDKDAVFNLSAAGQRRQVHALWAVGVDHDT